MSVGSFPAGCCLVAARPPSRVCLRDSDLPGGAPCYATTAPPPPEVSTVLGATTTWSSSSSSSSSSSLLSSSSLSSLSWVSSPSLLLPPDSVIPSSQLFYVSSSSSSSSCEASSESAILSSTGKMTTDPHDVNINSPEFFYSYPIYPILPAALLPCAVLTDSPRAADIPTTNNNTITTTITTTSSYVYQEALPATTTSTNLTTTATRRTHLCRVGTPAADYYDDTTPAAPCGPPTTTLSGRSISVNSMVHESFSSSLSHSCSQSSISDTSCCTASIGLSVSGGNNTMSKGMLSDSNREPSPGNPGILHQPVDDFLSHASLIQVLRTVAAGATRRYAELLFSGSIELRSRLGPGARHLPPIHSAEEKELLTAAVALLCSLLEYYCGGPPAHRQLWDPNEGGSASPSLLGQSSQSSVTTSSSTVAFTNSSVPGVSYDFLFEFLNARVERLPGSALWAYACVCAEWGADCKRFVDRALPLLCANLPDQEVELFALWEALSRRPDDWAALFHASVCAVTRVISARNRSAEQSGTPSPDANEQCVNYYPYAPHALQKDISPSHYLHGAGPGGTGSPSATAFDYQHTSNAYSKQVLHNDNVGVITTTAPTTPTTIRSTPSTPTTPSISNGEIEYCTVIPSSVPVSLGIYHQPQISSSPWVPFSTIRCLLYICRQFRSHALFLDLQDLVAKHLLLCGPALPLCQACRFLRWLDFKKSQKPWVRGLVHRILHLLVDKLRTSEGVSGRAGRGARRPYGGQDSNVSGAVGGKGNIFAEHFLTPPDAVACLECFCSWGFRTLLYNAVGEFLSEPANRKAITCSGNDYDNSKTQPTSNSNSSSSSISSRATTPNSDNPDDAAESCVGSTQRIHASRCSEYVGVSGHNEGEGKLWLRAFNAYARADWYHVGFVSTVGDIARAPPTLDDLSLPELARLVGCLARLHHFEEDIYASIAQRITQKFHLFLNIRDISPVIWAFANANFIYTPLFDLAYDLTVRLIKGQTLDLSKPVTANSIISLCWSFVVAKYNNRVTFPCILDYAFFCRNPDERMGFKRLHQIADACMMETLALCCQCQYFHCMAMFCRHPSCRFYRSLSVNLKHDKEADMLRVRTVNEISDFLSILTGQSNDTFVEPDAFSPYLIDICISRSEKMGICVQGRDKLLRQGSAGQWVYTDTGAMALQARLLAARGWAVAHVSLAEWLHLSMEHKRQIILRKMRECRLLISRLRS